MMTFSDSVLLPFLNSVEKYGERNAFCIDHQYYSYNSFAKLIAAIRRVLSGEKGNDSIGLVPNNNIGTYAAIFALWLEGKHYVPLHPEWPIDRCEDIISQVGIQTILDSSDSSRFNKHIINTLQLEPLDDKIDTITECKDNSIAYILFTSGSTGKPKGVPIRRENVSAFVNAMWDSGFRITEEDRCLQCFELTFDMSVFSYIMPLLKGACVYTVPNNVIKYGYIYELLEDYQLTVLTMAPATITYLRPYFSEISAPSVRFSLFAGEGLKEDVTSEWANCIPNARIFNYYGPTEDTVFCTYYEYRRNGGNKTHNGILSIGKSMSSGDVNILDDNGHEVKPGELGELVLHGRQLFDGYWKDEEKTKEAFMIAANGVKYYKSGDLCYFDDEGDIMYSGRKDHQVKIQGFRVELSEIEFHAHEILNGTNVVCIAFENSDKLTEIAMFIESTPFDTADLIEKMRAKMPPYMIPTEILFESKFPLNISGKIDRKALKTKLSKSL